MTTPQPKPPFLLRTKKNVDIKSTKIPTNHHHHRNHILNRKPVFPQNATTFILTQKSTSDHWPYSNILVLHFYRQIVLIIQQQLRTTDHHRGTCQTISLNQNPISPQQKKTPTILSVFSFLLKTTTTSAQALAHRTKKQMQMQ